MKRNKMTWLVATLLLSACAVVGCAAPVEPAGDVLAGNDDGVRAVLPEAEQTPIYEVPVELDGETATVPARTTVARHANLLDAGFNGLHGEEAVAAFLTTIVQQTVDQTGELPEGVVTVRDQEGDPSERAPNATCISCFPVDTNCRIVWCNGGICYEHCDTITACVVFTCEPEPPGVLVSAPSGPRPGSPHDSGL
ncbi:uncharacterized protein SOCEGT47_012910 [Sorangium cellulosum]|uniref:Secreted protein n=1 Tax=Sorangium cellulosum TaxID=56 RepID=A0A4P2PVP1_SORCE|nr:hypothetical protein [Sorangium cellulosum]AUX20817.1 uncharacterized protein SOCEGT47_012910 [Sorangium cellulosum]